MWRAARSSSNRSTPTVGIALRSEEHTSELQSHSELVCRLLLEKKNLMVVVVAAIIYMERAQRRIQVAYAQRMVGRRMYSGHSSHLPLKINTSGVNQLTFASAILVFPSTVTGFIDHPAARCVQDHLAPGSWLYMLVYVVLIIFFCYFYTAVTFNFFFE